MALADDVQARIPTRRLRELTNRDSNNATTVNTTVLGYAVTAVEGAFKTYAGEEYDGSLEQHVGVAADAVVERLKTWATGTKAGWDAAVQAIKDMAQTRARDRVIVETTSQLTPSTEVESGQVVRPKLADPETWDGYLPTTP